ncbi:MAG: hypothetical protein Q7U02_07815, partial [Desulfosalsimonadaceae bacterium]|nr:hypothetical protein [Desulfosalsimonadaceae bacterium]
LIFKISGMFPAKKKGYTGHVHKFFARFAYRVGITHKGIDIHVIGNRISILIVNHFLVQPALRFLVSQQWGLMLHASTICKNGCSILFSGQSGKGKTTVMALALTKGSGDWDFHSDDYNFFIANAECLTYQTPIHLFRDQLKWLPELSPALTCPERILLYFFGLLRRLTRERIKLPVRISHDRLWPGHCAPVKKGSVTKAICLMESSDNGRFHYRRLTPDSEMIAEWFAMNFAELHNFLVLIKKTGSMHRFDEWVDRWRSREEKHLKEQLGFTRIYQVRCPVFKNALNSPEIDQFLGFLDHVISSDG